MMPQHEQYRAPSSEMPTPEVREARIETEKEMISELRDAIHGMATDYRLDMQAEALERYSHLFHAVEERLRKELSPKQADAILLDPKRLDAEVAKELVMRLQAHDAAIVERRKEGKNGEVLLRDMLRTTAQRVSSGKQDRDEAVHTVRAEAEKRLGLFLAPTDAEIDRIVEQVREA